MISFGDDSNVNHIASFPFDYVVTLINWFKFVQQGPVGQI